MEDVINQSSNYNLKFRSIFILIQPNSRVPQGSKFWLSLIQTSSLIFMTVLTRQVHFFTSFCLGPADRFLAVLCVCRGLFGNRLVANLTVIWQVLRLSPSPERARSYVETSERKFRDVGFFGTRAKSKEEIKKFQRGRISEQLLYIVLRAFPKNSYSKLRNWLSYFYFDNFQSTLEKILC